MSKHYPNDLKTTDEVSIATLVNTLLKFKKSLILGVFLSFLVSINSFNTQNKNFEASAILEIGSFDKNALLIIETPEDLINNLNREFILKSVSKDNLELSITSPNNERLIKLLVKGPEFESSQGKLKEIIDYIISRHEFYIDNYFITKQNSLNSKINIVNQDIDFINQVSFDRLNIEKINLENNKIYLNSKIKALKEEIAYLSQMLNSNNLKNQEIIDRKITSIEQYLPFINLKIEKLKLIIEKDTNNLNLLNSNPELIQKRASLNPSLEQVIHSYQLEVIEYQAEKVRLMNELFELEEEKLPLKNSSGSNSLLQISPELMKLNKELDDSVTSLSILEKNLNKINIFLTEDPKSSNISIPVITLESWEISDKERLYDLIKKRTILKQELNQLKEDLPTRTFLVDSNVKELDISENLKMKITTFIAGLLLTMMLLLSFNALNFERKN